MEYVKYNFSIYSYSERPGTLAGREKKMEDDVTEETKNETTEIETTASILGRSEKKFIGQTVEVLIEKFLKNPAEGTLRREIPRYNSCFQEAL
jgi:tRNA-2-methylthio-N6-dimethylallyladenosine synthase